MRARAGLAPLLAALALAACGDGAPPSVPDPRPLTAADGEALLAAREARAAEHDPEAAAAPVPEREPDADTVTIAARLVDETGTPLPGAHLDRLVADADGVLAPELTARSDRAGVTLLILARAALPSAGALELAAAAPGRATQRLSLARERFEAAAVVNLGEWTLPPER